VNTYVCGFLFSWDMKDVLLIQKEHFPHKDKWIGIGGAVEADATDRSIFTTMREHFQAETGGINIPESNWHCFHIRQLRGDTKIYFFATFGDYIKAFQPYKESDPKFICSHNYVDLVFNNGDEYLFYTKYAIDIVLSEMRAGYFMQLNPEGINSWKTIKPSKTGEKTQDVRTTDHC
jgi:hypothetical protein